MPMHGVTAATAELDRDGSGFYITFVIEEGEPYKFGRSNIESALPGVDPGCPSRSSC